MNTNHLHNDILHSLKRWLQVCFAVTCSIILLGAATRLTGSGLSMTQLKVFLGVLPPLDQSDWIASFNEYKQSPEFSIRYKQQLSLSQYKRIFILEYLHRLSARVLGGLVFLVPFVYFCVRYYFVRRWMSVGFVVRLMGVFVLGGVQALFGWIMVKSGLETSTAFIQGEEVRVDPYRLAVHLATAFVIYGYLLYLIFETSERYKTVRYSGGFVRYLSFGISVSVFVTVVFGAFVAGTQAGVAYQSFPLMNGLFVPDDLHAVYPPARSFLEHMGSVQFYHRVFAYLDFLLIVCLFVCIRYSSGCAYLQRLVMLLFVCVCGQGVLGVVTLLHFKPYDVVSVVLGIVHQGGALVLFAVSLWMSFCVGRTAKLRLYTPTTSSAK